MVTLTEFNQRPSFVARLAEREPVRIQRYGRDYLVLHRVIDPIADLRAAGLIRSPKSTAPVSSGGLGLPDDDAERLYSEFEDSRRSDG